LLENCLSLRFRSWTISSWITGRAHRQRDIFHSNLFVRGAFEQNPEERTHVWGSRTRENTIPPAVTIFTGDPSAPSAKIYSLPPKESSLFGRPFKSRFLPPREQSVNFMHALTKPLNSSTQKNFRPFRLLAPACSLAPAAAVAVAPHKH
jgi:hypothetical protein